MRTLVTAIAIVLVSAVAAAAQDPRHTDGDKYKLRYENNKVMVLEYRDQPGEKTHLHFHPAFVLVALAPFKRRLTCLTAKSSYASSKPEMSCGRMRRRTSAKMSATHQRM